MTGPPLRVLALLEAGSINGTAKAVLEMAYEAKVDVTGGRAIEIAVANFIRGNAPTENSLTRALQSAQIPYFFIREKGRFDRSVIPQIRDFLGTWNADVVWTNSVKSHFLVNQAKQVCKWVAFHHGYTSTDFKMRLYNELDRVSLPRADRVLTVCHPFAEQMRARGVEPSRIRVQHMPIRRFSNSPEDAAALRAELHLEPAAKVVLSVGRLSHEKGHKDLISAFTRLRNEMPDLHLVIVGDGPERAKLDRGTENILFAGQRDDAKRFYAIADVFALPSYTEGTPNVLLEAMAAGVPIVATNVGGIPELVTNERHALLVPAASPMEMAKALRRILQSPELRNELVQAADKVVEAHSPRVYFEGMRRVFLEAAGA
jgi:glycosyltransferase involved in cell wall biosynthesis